MASQQPPRRPSWRDTAGSPAAPTGSAGPDRAWKNDPGANQSPHQTAGTKRRTRLFIWLGVLVGLIVLFVVVLLLLIPPRGATLVLVGSGYEENLLLPHNVQGWQTLTDLDKLSGDGRGDLHRSGDGPVATTENPDLWLKGWKDLDADPVILYLALHGGTDENDEPFFFLDDPSGKARLPLKTVFDHLENGKLKDSKKVLILDPTQMAADWRTGQLTNNFPAQVAAMAKASTAKNLYILIASGSGQRSWASEDWQRTIFGHYVVEALRGAADGFGGTTRDERVNLLELVEYVEQNVPAWVQANRDAVQVPVFIGDRGAAKKLELVQYKGPYTAPTPTARPLDRKELVALWAETDQLHKQIPPPHAYAPDLWRQYLDTTVRIEQLLRAGDPTGKKAALLSKRATLKNALTRSRRELWQSTTNALPMPGTLGLEATWTTADADKKRQELAMDKWMTSEAWAQLLKWADQGPTPNLLNRRLLRVYMTQRLLQDTLDNKLGSREGLQSVQKLLKILDEGDSMPRPVEGHFLLMLARDLPTPEPPPDTVLQALDVRIRAEKAALGNVLPDDDEKNAIQGKPRHLYAEYVWRWVEGEIKSGDRLRQDGENLLIGSPPKYWADASDLFKQAELKYRAARENANIVRTAVATRDRVFCELPYYAQWLARHRPEGDEVGKTESQVKDLIDLWKAAHELNADLEQDIAPDAAEREKQLAALQAKDRQVRDGFKTTVELVQTKIDNTTTQVNLQSVWHRIDDLLHVPFIPPERRFDLVDSARKGGSAFNTAFNAQPLQKVDVKPEVAEAEASARAKREGQLAIALLGGVRLRQTPNLPATLAEEKWLVAGKELRSQWDRLIADADALSDKSRKSGDLTAAYVSARDAESAARLLDGAASVRSANKNDSPCQLARELRLHNLLLWQTLRCGQDHWFEVDPNAPRPYYMAAGEGFRDDAVKLVTLKVDELDKLRLGSEKVKLANAAVQYAKMKVLSEDIVPIDLTRTNLPWRLAPDPGVPPGHPVVWLSVSGKVTTDAEFRQRRIPNGAFGQQQYLTPVRVAENDPKNEATLEGRYRGQVLQEVRSLANPLRNDLIVNRLPASPFSGLAVRAKEGVEVGGIVLVIDASGSMRTKVGNGIRYDLALAALDDVLGKIPGGVPVHLWCFGDDETKEGNRANIRRLGGGKDWTREDLMRAARKMKDEDRLHGNSPLARTMIEAFNKDLKDGKGFRALVALTDGDDNVLKDGVDAALTETFGADGNKDVFLNMVLFQADDTDTKRIEKQFAFLKERGGLTKAADGDDLAKKLRQLLIPRIELLGGAKKQEPVEVSYAVNKNLSWSDPIDPESYSLRLYRSQLRPGISLGRGERLLTGLVSQGGQLSVQRLLFGQYELERRVSGVKLGDDRNGWQAGVIDHYYNSEDRGLRMLVTLEETKSLKPSNGPVKQIQPGFRWLEITPDSKTTPGTLQYWNDEQYPAPTLGVLAKDWPRTGADGVGSTVEMWWSDAGDTDPPADLTLDIKGTSATNIEVAGQKFTVQITSEPRAVAVRADKEYPVTEVKKCLVLRFIPVEGKGKRIWARIKPDSGTVRGEEHRYYRTADDRDAAYTAIFWELEEKDALPLKLDISSLDSFKEKAAAQKRYERFTMGVPGGSPRVLPVRLEKRGE